MNGREFPAPIFFAHVVDKINSENKVDALKELAKWKDDSLIPNLTLLDANGKVLYPEGHQEFNNWNNIVKPIAPYEFVNVTSKGLHESKVPGFGPPPFGAEALVRLKGASVQYLLISPPDRPKGRDMAPFPLIGIVSLLLSLLLGIGTTMAFVYNGVQRGVSEADRVIGEIYKGNLKARFDIRRKDEFGEAMLRFNLMADEVEKLVLNLKDAEKSRTLFFQELAHDLRTPIASLKNLMEILDTKRNSLDQNVQNELTGLALKEIHYFERLVEDLLFLAQVKTPSRQIEDSNVNLSNLLSESIDDFSLRSEHKDHRVESHLYLDQDLLTIHGDDHLLRRLIRNALENAFAFAKSVVSVSLRKVGENGIEIIIEDDGPGFSEDALKLFGSRRVTRKLEDKPDGRLSVGLGSVVMKTICIAHQGTIKAENRMNGQDVLGARLTFTFPRV